MWQAEQSEQEQCLVEWKTRPKILRRLRSGDFRNILQQKAKDDQVRNLYQLALPQLWSFTMIRIQTVESHLSCLCFQRFFHQSATLIWDCLISGKKCYSLLSPVKQVVVYLMDQQIGCLINEFDLCQPITGVYYGQLTNESA